MSGNNNLKFPETIEELRNFCVIKGISLFQVGFYLGSDHIGPNAHGIYKDYWSGDFIVYRNMEDGSREVIYQGQDEAAAVKETCRQLLYVIKNPGDQDIYDVNGIDDHFFGGGDSADLVEETIDGQVENSDQVEENISSQEDYSSPVEENYSSQEELSNQVEDESFYEKEDLSSDKDNIFDQDQTKTSVADSIFDKKETESSVAERIFRKEESESSTENNIFGNEENVSHFGKSIFDNEYSYTSSSDLFSTKENRPLADNKSSENSWMDINTPLMKAAPNEDLKEEKTEDEKSLLEDAFGIENVKDLKSGLVFCIYKLSYYLSRFCYYVSGIIFAFSRFFINICLMLSHMILKQEENGAHAVNTKYMVEEINRADDIPYFEEKDFDDKILYLWDKTKYYTSCLSIHLSKLFLRFGNYCYQNSEKQGENSKDDKVAREVVSPKREEKAADELLNIRAEAETVDEAVELKTEENLSSEVVNQIKAKQVVDEVLRQENVYSHEYVEVKEETDKYVQHVGGNSLFETGEEYDLKKIANEHDYSLNNLIGPLEDNDSGYSDYNDEYEDNNMFTENIGKFLLSLIIAFIIMIIMFASFDNSSKSRNRRSGYNSYYNSSSYNW